MQFAARAPFPPGDAREDWTIIRALSGVLAKPLPYDDLAALRKAMLADAPHFANPDRAPENVGADPAIWTNIGATGTIAKTPFQYPVTDFYLTNPIARASHVMAECSTLFVKPRTARAAE